MGQAIDVRRRLATHRRTHTDIVAVRFTPVRRQDLSDTEYALIQDRQARGIALRNKAMVSNFVGASLLDMVVDQQVQAEWMEADPDADDIVIGTRAEAAARRARSRERFEGLRTHERWPEILDCLADYVGRVIPHPHQTEGRTWTVTALPSTNRRPDHRRLAAVSINNVEVLVLMEDLVDGVWEPWFFLNAALEPTPPSELASLPRLQSYRSTGELRSWHLDGLGVPELLDEPKVLKSARALAVGQLRKGSTMFGPFHNDSLADAIFLRLQEKLGPRGDLGVMPA